MTRDVIGSVVGCQSDSLSTYRCVGQDVIFLQNVARRFSNRCNNVVPSTLQLLDVLEPCGAYVKITPSVRSSVCPHDISQEPLSLLSYLVLTPSTQICECI